MTGNTVIDALRIEVATQAADAAMRAGIDAELSDLLGADWADVPYVLITGHRRENFGDGIRPDLRGDRRPGASAFPITASSTRCTSTPTSRMHVNRLLGGLPNVGSSHLRATCNFVALMARCRLVLTDSGGVQEEAPSLGKPVLVMRDTTERPEGVAAGTALLTGPNAADHRRVTPPACSPTRPPTTQWPPRRIPTGMDTPPSGLFSGSGSTSPKCEPAREPRTPDITLDLTCFGAV